MTSIRALALTLACAPIAAIGCHAPADAKGDAGDVGRSPEASAAADPAAAWPDAGPGFQGMIDMDALLPDPDEGTKTERIMLTVRGDRVRWSIGGASYRVYDAAEHMFYSVFPSDQLVMATPAASAMASDAGAVEWTMTTFDPNGRVQGEPCERVHVVAPRRPALDACVTSAILPGFPLYLASSVAGAVTPFDAMLVARGLFPLAASGKPVPFDGGAHPKGARFASFPRLITTHLVRRPVSPDEVAVPAYRRVDSTSLDARVHVPR